LRSKKADIIKKLLILFNVKPSPTTEMKFFRKLRNQQEELVNQLSDGNINDVTKAIVVLGLYKESFDFLRSLLKRHSKAI
jgi:hypothetical protein